ncbi:dihydroxy-acid dehydratase [Mesorhizobium sp. M3A.F.Ca.ET.201.01.1.1]|uniref:IlvD/Edd family dehydratase n=1 Tax=Mesorhizobium sp. M3A.F.Ca.ET.201.01.1.1 TaxID=2563946 RepID=UPI001093F6ED|nr:IlvD/Edd family dehydratase [Mesorhizobium sp. M3A.F.Ca.ET.201.01.1.1]TGS71764.1 dihydroxy-acid dehydratase [Mesorhizobium sp. M3A.F.Ca.ET.201.01.1.1]
MPAKRLRSQAWFDNPDNPDMTALYIERFLNFGLSQQELQSGRPLIGIAQTGSDLVPCNRHHIALAQRTREGIRDAGGIAFEIPVHPLQETGKRPTAAIDRNLAYLSLVEVLHGYPLDGVVLTTGCDKTTPALLMAAATVDLPAIVLSGGPMLNGYHEGEEIGSGTIIWKARQLLAAGKIDARGFLKMAAGSAPSIGHCNTMGTALTMNSLAEVLGMSLPGCAAIPAPHRDRAEMAYLTGRRAVELVHEDLRPSRILTRAAFENAIIANTALGGSTNAQVHVTAIARHAGVELMIDDWEIHGYDVPLLVDLQPAGKHLASDFHRAGGVPALVSHLLEAGRFRKDALSVTGRTTAENSKGLSSSRQDIIRPFSDPLMSKAGFRVLRGNMFDSAIIKTSVISPEFRKRYLSDPGDPEAFEARAIVFEGPEDYHANIDNPALGIDDRCILIMRNVGPKGYPGSAEVVNMRPPAVLIEGGVLDLPCLGDGRQSGTSASPSILHASPEAAEGSGMAIVRTGDRIRIDLRLGRVDMLVPQNEIDRRRLELLSGSRTLPESQTPWQELFRAEATQLSDGMVLRSATKYQRVDQKGLPRDSH